MFFSHWEKMWPTLEERISLSAGCSYILPMIAKHETWVGDKDRYLEHSYIKVHLLLPTFTYWPFTYYEMFTKEYCQLSMECYECTAVDRCVISVITTLHFIDMSSWFCSAMGLVDLN